MKVQLFVPCFIQLFSPQLSHKIIKLLEYVGCQNIQNKKAFCCGQPAYNSGMIEPYELVGKYFFQNFQKDLPILVPSTTCCDQLNLMLSKNDNKKAYQVIELSDFLHNTVDYHNSKMYLAGNAVFHHSCSSLRSNDKTPSLHLLQQVKGLNWVDWDNQECCGFGGSFFVKYSPISMLMAKNKLSTLPSNNINFIVGSDASCFLSLNRAVGKMKLGVKTMHFAEVLCEGW